MGDRAIVVLKKDMMTDGVTHTICSPQMYLHWQGSPNNVANYIDELAELMDCLLYTSPSPRDATLSRMPSSA